DIWSLTSDLRYIYDGWNLILELIQTTDNEQQTTDTTKSYTWGLDLSQTRPSAPALPGALMPLIDLTLPTCC
ncbi:MAG: hypothetical protein RRC34_16280, partial [Lentisphaeria bacterium]|nr:hypothetical protein [Lentisphaeria bacterium]